MIIRQAEGYVQVQIWASDWLSVPENQRVSYLAKKIGETAGRYLARLMIQDPGVDEDMYLRISRGNTIGDFENWYIEHVKIREE